MTAPQSLSTLAVLWVAQLFAFPVLAGLPIIGLIGLLIFIVLAPGIPTRHPVSKLFIASAIATAVMVLNIGGIVTAIAMIPIVFLFPSVAALLLHIPTYLLVVSLAFLIFSLLLLFVSAAGVEAGKTSVRAGCMAVSAIAVLTVGVHAAEISNAPLHQAVAKLRAHDVSSGERIKLSGTVGIAMPMSGTSSDRLPCEALCQRLLLTRAVSKIIVGYPNRYNAVIRKGDPAIAYRLADGSECESPDGVRYALPVSNYVFPNEPASETTHHLRKAFENSSSCVVAKDALMHEADFVIELAQLIARHGGPQRNWTVGASVVEANRLEIRTRLGQILFQQTEVAFAEWIDPYNALTRWYVPQSDVPAPQMGKRFVRVGELGLYGRDVLPQVLDTPGLPPAI